MAGEANDIDFLVPKAQPQPYQQPAAQAYQPQAYQPQAQPQQQQSWGGRSWS